MQQTIAPVPTVFDDSPYFSILWLMMAVPAAIHVFRNCRRIGEPAFFNVTGTLLLFPLYYFLWLLWWPGTLRRWIGGGSIDDLATAWAYQRIQKMKAEGRTLTPKLK